MLEEQLKHKHNEIKRLSDEIPQQLAKKIQLYAECQLIIGKLHATSVYEYGKAYADRKATWGKTIVETEGTQAVKEGMAEVACAALREIEAKAEGEQWQWKNAYNSYGEIIQALKMELRVLVKELGSD